MIVKTFFGTHLDLSKVVQISDVSIIDRYPCRIGFHIDIQLRDAPITYSQWCPSVDDEPAPGFVEGLQVKVDDLVGQWKQSQLDSAHGTLLYRIHNRTPNLRSGEIREWITTGESPKDKPE